MNENNENENKNKLNVEVDDEWLKVLFIKPLKKR